MISGFYSSASGMVSQLIALNHITDNVTNANVSGYKKQEVVFNSFDSEFQHEVSKKGVFAKADLASGVEAVQGITNFTQGAMKYTGDHENIALDGPGFYKVETPFGQFLTRQGVLRVSSEGSLVTKDGFKVLGQDGVPLIIEDIKLSQGKYGIDTDGTLYADLGDKKEIYGKIGLFEFASPEKLQRAGYGLFKNSTDSDAGEVVSVNTSVHQKYQEMSNANAIESMVDMITNQRLYESNSNALRQVYQSLGRFVEAIG